MESRKVARKVGKWKVPTFLRYLHFVSAKPMPYGSMANYGAMVKKPTSKRSMALWLKPMSNVLELPKHPKRHNPIIHRRAGRLLQIPG